MLSTSLILALAMQCSPSIHPDTVQDVARTESGYNPYAIGVVGGKGIFPLNIDDALAHVERLKAQGKNFSIGLMQINQSNFSRFKKTPRQLFNPCENLSVFEKIMTDCYVRGKTLLRGLSCYYSGNFYTGQKPEGRFNNTSYTERIGYSLANNYIVPSTKADKQNISPVQQTPGAAPGHLIKWPDRVVRGDLNPSKNKTSENPISYPHRIIRGELSSSK